MLLRGSTPAVFFHHCNGSTFHGSEDCSYTNIVDTFQCVGVAHALAPYSNVGLTAPVCIVLIILELAPQCVPANVFSRANFLIPFVDLWFP